MPSSPGRRFTALARHWPPPARWLPLARQHWLLGVLLTAGLVLRVLAQIAYRPALFYIDSMKYLFGAYPGNDPVGYQAVIKPLLLAGNLDLVVAIQHLLGLAMAVVLYLVLLRRGVPRWLAALATAPVLLDGYQLQIEQNIMPDVLFETCIVAGLAALLWTPRPRTGLVIVGGLALGASATARQVGEIFILPALAYLLVAIPGWRDRMAQSAVLCFTFVLPIAAASYGNYVIMHRFGLAPYAGGSTYGRMAAAADCPALALPAYERALCPTAKQQGNGPDWLDHHQGSPIKTFQAPAGMRNATVVNDFNRQVLFQQPGRVLAAIGKDAIKLFAVTRVTDPGDTDIGRWQFQPSSPQYAPYMVIRNGQVIFTSFTPAGAVRSVYSTAEYRGGSPVAVRPLAAFLHGYQLRGGYTPGPLLLLATLAGLAGTLSLLRRRATAGQREAARACLLMFTAAASVLLVSDAFEFSWRYQLPALITLPPAAALALTALFAHRTGPVPAAGP
ncbi:MAG TPA: phospholipid carrier-dependent glycosyltransferase, partial [Streptosporangiaceae bacterium]